VLAVVLCGLGVAAAEEQRDRHQGADAGDEGREEGLDHHEPQRTPLATRGGALGDTRTRRV
jgi:hypothetical protein